MNLQEMMENQPHLIMICLAQHVAELLKVNIYWQ